MVARGLKMNSRSSENSSDFVRVSQETLVDNIENQPAREPHLAKTIANELTTLEKVQADLHTRALEASTGGAAKEHSDFDHIDRAQLVYAAVWDEVEKINAADYSSKDDISRAFNELKNPESFKAIITKYMLANREQITADPKFAEKTVSSTKSSYYFPITAKYKAVSDYYSVHGGEYSFDTKAFLNDVLTLSKANYFDGTKYNLSTYKDSVLDSLVDIYQSIAVQRFYLKKALSLSTIQGVDAESVKKYEEAVEAIVNEIHDIQHESFISSSWRSNFIGSIDSNETDELIKKATNSAHLQDVVKNEWSNQANQKISDAAIALEKLESKKSNFNPKSDLNKLSRAYEEYKKQGLDVHVIATQIDHTITSLKNQRQSLLDNINRQIAILEAPCTLDTEQVAIVGELDASIERAANVDEFEQKLENYNDSLRAQINNLNNFKPADSKKDQLTDLATEIKENLDNYKAGLAEFRNVRDESAAAIELWRTTHFAESSGPCTPIRKAWKAVAANDKLEAKKGYLNTLSIVDPFLNPAKFEAEVNEQAAWKQDELEVNVQQVFKTVKENVKAKQKDLSEKVKPIKAARSQCVNELRALQSAAIENPSLVLDDSKISAKQVQINELRNLEKSVKKVSFDSVIKKLEKLKLKIEEEKPIVKQVSEENAQAIVLPKAGFFKKHTAKLVGTPLGMLFGAGLMVLGLIFAPETLGASLSLTMMGIGMIAAGALAMGLTSASVSVGVDHARSKKRKREDEAFVASKRMNNTNIYAVVAERPKSAVVNVPGNSANSSASTSLSSSNSSPESSPIVSPRQGSPSQSGYFARGSQSYQEPRGVVQENQSGKPFSYQ